MKTLLLVFLCLLTGMSGLTSCKAYQSLEHYADAATPEASAPAADVTSAVQPAPAGLSNAQARRYYNAQLEAQKNAGPRKVKDSNNTTTTYEQKISNVSIGLVVLFGVVCLVLGFVLGAGFILKKPSYACEPRPHLRPYVCRRQPVERADARPAATRRARAVSSRPQDVLQLRLVAVLMQLWRRPRLAWQFIRMPLLDLAEFRKLTNFLLEPVVLTAQLLPQLRRAWWARPWFGPGDRLAGLTFTEWIDAEAALFQYRQTQSVQALNRLVAVLYRPGRWWASSSTSDRRHQYAQHQVARRAEQAERLPLDVRHAILLYYDSCRGLLIKQHPDVFPQDEETPATAKTPQSPAPAYLRILRELAQSPDKYEVIGQQPIGNILFDLAERIKQAAELEKKLAEIRST